MDSEFATVLRNRVQHAHRSLEQAREAGVDDEVYWYGARLLDLLDRARAHGIETAGWIPAPARAAAAGRCD